MFSSLAIDPIEEKKLVMQLTCVKAASRCELGSDVSATLLFTDRDDPVDLEKPTTYAPTHPPTPPGEMVYVHGSGKSVPNKSSLECIGMGTRRG